MKERFGSLACCSFTYSLFHSLNYWLVKSEPDTYGWPEFVGQGRATWDGVRNYQARNNLNAMRIDDLVLFYHSVTSPGVVGLATVVREAYPDPTVSDEPGVRLSKARDRRPCRGTRRTFRCRRRDRHGH